MTTFLDMEPPADGFGRDLMTMRRAIPHSAEVRAAFNNCPAAVGAICAVVDGVPRGMIASSIAVGVSYDPPLVLFSAQKNSRTWPHLRLADRVGISILSEDQGDVCRNLSSRRDDRFEGVAVHRTAEGAMFVHGSTGWLDCTIQSVSDAGDHEVVLFHVLSVSVAEQIKPLIFHRMQFRPLDYSLK